MLYPPSCLGLRPFTSYSKPKTNRKSNNKFKNRPSEGHSSKKNENEKSQENDSGVVLRANSLAASKDLKGPLPQAKLSRFSTFKKMSDVKEGDRSRPEESLDLRAVSNVHSHSHNTSTLDQSRINRREQSIMIAGTRDLSMIENHYLRPGNIGYREDISRIDEVNSAEFGGLNPHSSLLQVENKAVDVLLSMKIADLTNRNDKSNMSNSNLDSDSDSVSEKSDIKMNRPVDFDDSFDMFNKSNRNQSPESSSEIHEKKEDDGNTLNVKKPQSKANVSSYMKTMNFLNNSNIKPIDCGSRKGVFFHYTKSTTVHEPVLDEIKVSMDKSEMTFGKYKSKAILGE
jgi:hypothetical protein